MSVPRDDPAVAQSIVVHAETLCEREDHLWDVIRELSIPTDQLTDHRNQNRVDFKTEEMVRALLYKEIRGYSQNEFADRMRKSSTLVKSFGFDVQELRNAPSQQDLSYAWCKFSDGTQKIIEAAAEGIAQAAVEHDVIREGLVAVLPSDESGAGSKEATKKDKREISTRFLRLCRQHGIAEFDTKRAPHRKYSDEEVWDMLARICHNTGSAHSEAEYGWLTDDDVTCADSTFLRALKKTATPDDLDAQLTLSDFSSDDAMPKIDRIRDELISQFSAATDHILKSIRGQADLFDSRSKTTVAIDYTHEQFHVYPWLDKDEGIPKPDYPAMVSGYYDSSDKEYKYVYKFATITLVGNHPPIILGIEPVKENSAWEPEDAPSYSKGDVVARLLDQALEIIDIDEVLLDRGFYVKDVYAAIDDRDLIYTGPVPKYEDDLQAIKQIEEHPKADAAVKHDVPLGIDGEVHHKREYLYEPSRSDDADGKYAVFVTNRDRVEPDEITHVCNSYSRRWDIENQYKSIKDFLPKTSSKDYRVRLSKFVFAALIYNLWRLADYLIKVAIGKDIRAPPELTAKTFVRVLGEFLREYG